MAESVASRALNQLLDEGGELADAVRAVVHRTVLWRYRTGRGKPDVDTAAKLEEASAGRVQANAWPDLDGAADDAHGAA